MMECLPDFLIIGAQKAGTTWLSMNLRQHPDVFMPDYEIHFFDKDYNFKKGIEWYKKHFFAVKNEKAVGEKTPDYLWANGRGVEGHLADVHRNIYNTIPKTKLIVVLRNPVERAISAVNHIIYSARISPLHNIDDLLVGDNEHLVQGHGVIEYGKYYQQIKAYHEHFDLGQMLILIFEEDIVQDPASGLRKVCRFLGIDQSFKFQNRHRKINEAIASRTGLIFSYYLPFVRPFIRQVDRHLTPFEARPSMPVIHQLYEMYKEENEKLFELLGRRLHAWELNTR